MADPGADAIMLGGFDDGYFGAHLLRAVDKFSALSGVNVLAGKWREEPGGAVEQVGIGKLHAGVFFARHGMPGEESMTGAPPERSRGAPDNFCLRAADVGYEGLGQQRWTESADQIEDRDHRGCQHHQIAAAHGIGGIGGSRFDGAAVLGPLQNWSAIAPDDSSGEPAFLQGEAQRASDQAGSDDGDLLESHWGIGNL